MKAIILAAGRDMVKEHPACLSPIGDSSILSKQVSLFHSIGINKIIIVIGKDNKCWNLKYRNHVKKMNVKVIENSDNHLGNSQSLKLAFNEGLDDYTIISDGDTFFNKHTIAKLINNKFQNVLLSRLTNVLTDSGTKIKLNGNKVKDIGRNLENDDLPFFIYGGLIKINKIFATKLYRKLKNDSKNNEFFTNSISEIIRANSKNVKLYAHQISNTINSQSILKGGSYAGTKKISLVRKETKTWTQKLKDEIKWIENLPSDLIGYFPKIINKGSTKDSIYYEMPYYNHPSLRRLIFEGGIDAKEVSIIVSEIIEFMFNHIFNKNQKLKDKSYPYTIHLERMKNRINDTENKSVMFNNIFSHDEIIINGKKYKNLKPLLLEIENYNDLIKLLIPKNISMVHGDLHPDNILINNINEFSPKYIFIDPRGLDNTYNYSYDLGKIWHSFHGMYDILHEGLFDINYEINNKKVSIDFKYNNYPIINLYNDVIPMIYNSLNNMSVLNNDVNWQLRLFFAEVSHFCSVMPFHLRDDDSEHLPLALYATGVLLINNFIDIYKHSLVDKKLDKNKLTSKASAFISSPLNID